VLVLSETVLVLSKTVLVLSETVLVLVIESSLWWSYIRSIHDLPLNATELVQLSDHEHEHEHETGPETQTHQPLFFHGSQIVLTLRKVPKYKTVVEYSIPRYYPTNQRTILLTSVGSC